MKYQEVIEKIKQGAEIRYFLSGFIGSDYYTLCYGEDEEAELHHQTIKKILNTFDCKYKPVWMQGSEEGGYLILRNKIKEQQ